MSNKNKTEFGVWHEYDVLFGDNTIYMGSHGDDGYDETGVDYAMAERVIKNLHVLDKRLHEDGITIKMNNPGGCTVHGMAIYDAIKACKNHVAIIGYGHIMSMGSLIFQAADTRIMTENSRMMIHMGQVGLSSETLNFYTNVDEFKFMDKTILDIYLKRIKESKPRFSLFQLKNKIITDWFLGAKEAIDFGLCDKIYGQD